MDCRCPDTDDMKWMMSSGPGKCWSVSQILCSGAGHRICEMSHTNHSFIPSWNRSMNQRHMSEGKHVSKTCTWYLNINKGFCDSAALVLPDHTWNSRTLDLTWVILMTVLVILRLNNSLLDAVLFECAQVSHTRIILLVALIDWFLWTHVKDVAFDIMFIIEWAVGAWLAGRLFLSCTWQDVRPSKNSSWFINLPKKIHAKRTIQGNQSHLLRS